MNALFNVSVDEKSVMVMGNVIRDILVSAVDQSTMVAALETLKKACSPVVTVTGCTFTAGLDEEEEQ